MSSSTSSILNNQTAVVKWCNYSRVWLCPSLNLIFCTLLVLYFIWNLNIRIQCHHQRNMSWCTNFFLNSYGMWSPFSCHKGGVSWHERSRLDKSQSHTNVHMMPCCDNTILSKETCPLTCFLVGPLLAHEVDNKMILE